MQKWLSPLIFFSNNWISRVGVVLVSAAAVFWLFLLPTFVAGHAASAYMGIVLFLLLPTAFFMGLALIPLGIFLNRKRSQQALAETAGPALTWSNPAFRRLATFTGMVTFVNVLIGANLSYRAVEHMEGVQFCGTTCHTVMIPEYTAYQNSPHSKVECVKCHIGPGANWFVKSKLSGLYQVYAVTANNFERPVPTPIRNLRPARETCEGCHWPEKYGGDRLRVIPHFDDAGKMTRSVLLMRIGGASATGSGIHSAHVGPGIRIRYAHSDEKRATIPWVEYQRDGKVSEFLAAKTNKADVAAMPVREMDCVDCHNRPSHTFEAPERGLDNAMARGSVPPDLPEIRKIALEAMKKEYPSTEQALSAIPASIESFYKQKHGDVYGQRQADIARAAKGVLAVWQRNVFPEMKVTWGSYPNHLGHNDYPGCFRCHDGEHKTGDGNKAIEQDCNSCHVMLAMEESDPKILKDLGVTQ